MVQTFAEPDASEHRPRPGFALLAWHPAEHERHRDVFDGVEPGEQIVGLENETDVLLPEFGEFALVEPRDDDAADPHASARRAFHTGKLVEQRGFA